MKKRLTRALLYLQRVMPPEKPDPVSSLRICWYLQERLEFDAVWDAYNPAPELPDRIDELWFVASSWAFLEDRFRQQTLKIFPLADRVFWLNNDRNVAFHAYHLGRIRPDAQIVALTTVSELAARFGMTKTLNWNRLTYDPIYLERVIAVRKRRPQLYYYGSLRPGREATFDRYFPELRGRLVVAAANGKDRKKYEARYPMIYVTPRAPNVFSELSLHRATPILEDEYARSHYVSPPNRFYEALSTGTAMYFEPECTPMWALYGYDVRPYLITFSAADMLRRAPAVAAEQAEWRRDYRRELDKEFDQLVEKARLGKIGLRGPPLGAKKYL